MTTGEWVGLFLFVAPWVIVGIVDVDDLWRLVTGRMTFSEYIWAARDLWRAGLGPFPWRSVYLPALVSISPIGLWLHFWT
jgi:hypothetical protein